MQRFNQWLPTRFRVRRASGRPRDRTRLQFALACVVCLGANVAARAGEWPEILGPHRNGIAADDERLARQWPSGGPTVTWEIEVGAGYAGVAVAGGRVFLFHRIDDQEIIEALDATSGKSIWKQATPTSFYPSVGGGDGPLCVPTVAGSRVITYGAQGVLSAWDVRSGKALWQRKTHEDFRAQEGYFGAGSCPLVAGEIVIVNVGGSKLESGIVGFDLATGATKWTQTSEPASYSAPVLTRFSTGTGPNDSLPAAIVLTRYQCVALDPVTGAIFWQFPFGKRGPTVNAALPVFVHDRLFLTASYGIGATYDEVGLTGFKPIWERENDRLLSSQYATPIADNGLLYGIHGRDDLPPSDLRCVDPMTEKVLWTEPSFGYGTLLKADGKLIIVKTDGEIVLAELNPEGFRPRSKARVFRGTVRALPALSNGALYLRNEKTLKRFDVSAQ